MPASSARSLADELTARGWTDVTVVDRGPLFATGGSTSHAPGLVFQTNPSKTMTEFANYTVEKFGALDHPDGWAFNPVGGLEVATTPERWADLHRKAGWASRGESRRTADRRTSAWRCIRCSTPTASSAASTPPPTDWPRRCAPWRRRPVGDARGATFRPHTEVLGIVDNGRRVTGVHTADGVIDADIVCVRAGFWGAQFARQVGLVVPLVPMAHQYARTGQIEALVGRNTELAEAGLPILRHQDQDLYFREHVDRIGIGYYGHRPMPVDMSTLAADTAGEPMPSMLPFTEEDFAPAWRESLNSFPYWVIRRSRRPSTASSRSPPTASRSWASTASWRVLGRRGGLGDALGGRRQGHGRVDHRRHPVDRRPRVRPVPLRGRRPQPEISSCTTSSQAFVEVYDVIHPHQFRTPCVAAHQPVPRAQQELGAYFFEGGGWERPAWYEANAGLLDGPQRRAGVPRARRMVGAVLVTDRVAEAHWTRQPSPCTT